MLKEVAEENTRLCQHKEEVLQPLDMAVKKRKSVLEVII